jgi:hypothetical protein
MKLVVISANVMQTVKIRKYSKQKNSGFQSHTSDFSVRLIIFNLTHPEHSSEF